MNTPTDPMAIVLARLEVKLDQLLQTDGDHELRLRKLEESSQSKNWQATLANSIMTAVNAALAGTIFIGG